ncbi:MAG: carboxypeptidase regulatory-like domain-containing protein [Rhodospirillaceae bacterium]|nr:carboxypeptidase regulatory-like domain-containing protein [Rhodospirillaceae bacterium]
MTNRFRFPRPAGLALGILILTLAIPAASLAQDNGLVRGTVTDDSGAVIPGATATLLSDAIIGGSRSTVTNASGVFRFPGLPAGDYAVEIALSGFDTLRFEGVRVGQNTTATLDAAMSLSGVQEVVQVVAEAPLLDVSTNASITTFNSELVEELPTERNFYDYIHISPGITQVNSGGGGDRAVAFGSNQQSNSWNIDGIETSAPETGSSWGDPNVDMIEEVEIIGIGAPAEFGNATGGTFNIVTKKGGDTFSGTGNYFYQSDALTFPEIYADSGTGEPVSAGSPDAFAFQRDNYQDITFTLGGPVIRERMWFMTGGQYSRDSSWEAGNDPALATADNSENDKLTLKLTTKLSDRHEVFVNTHLEDWAFIGGSSPNVTASAAFVERGATVSVAGGLTSTISDTTLFEARYSGWWASDIHDSPTGSFDMPFVNYDAEPTTTYEGGIVYPWDYRTWSNQFNAKVTHYADDFLGAQHEFRFGVQIAQGVAVTGVAAGPNSAYQYQSGGYLYQVIQEPYRYGGISRDNGFFLDDTVTVSDRLTLNLGVRLDINRGEIPAYELLASVDGESEFTAINAVAVEGNAPGDPDIVAWNLVSPRIGFTFRPDEEGRSAIKGFFGIHYDQNVIGNWDAPAPGATPWQLYALNDDGTLGDLLFATTVSELAQPEDLLAPRSYHYTAGYDREIGNNMSVGVQYVHKYTDRLVGWSILGGQYESIQWADPYNGTPITLLNQVAQPTLVKGNHPGDFPGAQETYEQTYDGVIFHFAARDAGRWNLQGSYTLSKSVGLIPRPWFEAQNNPFYGSRTGQDPNSYLNLNDGQRLQADRPHMFRLQGVLFLPYDFLLAVNANVESGKPFSRQVRATGVTEQPANNIIVETAGSRDGLRHPALWSVDARLGKRFDIGDVSLKLDAYVYNALNSTASIGMASLRLEDPGEQFIPDAWIEPRRLMVLAGFVF